MEKIKEQLEKEQEKLLKLEEKKQTLESKIKTAKSEIEKLSAMIKQRRFSETEDVLQAKGLTLVDIIDALKKGDLLTLQDRLDNSNNEIVKNSSQNNNEFS